MDDDFAATKIELIEQTTSAMEPMEPIMEDTDMEKTVNMFRSLVDTMDTLDILNVVGNRLFDHYTLWDLMVAKSRLYADAGCLKTIVSDTEILLCELKILIESCMKPINVGKVGIKKKSHECIEFDDMLTSAMGLDTNMWVKKEFNDINYKHTLLDVNQLFPPHKKLVQDTVKVAKNIGEGDVIVSDVQGTKIRENKENVSKVNAEAEEDKLVQINSKQTVSNTNRTAKKKRLRRAKVEATMEEKKGDYNCEKCGKKYSNFSSWYKHMEQQCASRTSLKVSIKTIGNKYYCNFKDCSTPQKSFASTDDVHDHWALNHVTDDEKIIPCLKCSEKFATIGAINFHMAEIHPSDNLVASRKKVASSTSKPISTSESENSRSKKKYLCLKCGASMSKDTGSKHEPKCNGIYVRKPEYKKVGSEIFCTVAGCNVGFSFSSMYGLRKHFHTTHTREDEKIYGCQYCGEKFSFKTARNLHITEKHLKSHKCDICGKGFGGKSKLDSHKLLHTGEKPFACEICDYRTVKKFNLESHMESKHAVFAPKEFECGICNKKFVTIGRVRRHISEMHSKMEDSDHNGRKKRKSRKAQQQLEKNVAKDGPKEVLMMEGIVVQQHQEQLTPQPQQPIEQTIIIQPQVQGTIQATNQYEQQDAVIYL